MNPEVFVFLAMTACGAAISVVFDFIRAVRMCFKPNSVAVAVSDVAFWVFATFCAAACAWNLNSGIFRFYEPLGLILGAVLYFLLLSRWILRVFLFIIENIFKFVRFILKILLTPTLFLYRILVVPVKNILTNKGRKGQDS